MKYKSSYDLYKRLQYIVIVQLFETPTIVLSDLYYFLTRPMDFSRETDKIVCKTDGTV